MEFFDRDFPGHYLRLNKKVSTTVIALIPPTQGIRATLTNMGVSRVVIDDGGFQDVEVPHGLQSVALSAPVNATGVFELNLQPELLQPFEAIGVDTFWEFRRVAYVRKGKGCHQESKLFCLQTQSIFDFWSQRRVSPLLFIRQLGKIVVRCHIYNRPLAEFRNSGEERQEARGIHARELRKILIVQEV